MSIATASQHLTKLRLGGIISARRDGRRQIYTVDDPHVPTMVQQIFEHFAPDGTPAPTPHAAAKLKLRSTTPWTPRACVSSSSREAHAQERVLSL